jgi:proteasome lid subunit RPN8/RPN11
LAKLALLALVAAALAAFPARAADLPSAVYAGGPTYATAEAAAIAALKVAAPLSREYEYGGAVLKTPDGYVYTAPVTTRESSAVRYRIELPASGSLAAVYHTHPDGGESKLFSPEDVRQSKALGLPSYIAALEDGSVRVFEPGMPVIRVGPGSVSVLEGAAPGRVVFKDLLRK